MHGAVALTNSWLKKDSSTNVAVYVIWSPQLGAKEKHVASATALVPDRRAKHYWDERMLIGTAFQSLLGLPVAAWDTWMLFDRTATWRGDDPPNPAWWEHQLRAGPPELHLNPERFAAHAGSLEANSHRR